MTSSSVNASASSPSNSRQRASGIGSGFSFAGNNTGVALNGTLGATVRENLILSSRADGIRVNRPASGNLVAENTIDGSPLGIDFRLTAESRWAVNNTFRENRISNNTCGIKGPTAGNTLSENIFTLNGVDICP